MQNIYELKIDIACVTEPASAPQVSSRWVTSSDGLAAIYYGSNILNNKCVTYVIDRNFVIVKFKQMYIVSVYIAPSESDHDFNVTLDKISTIIRNCGGNFIVTGDYGEVRGRIGVGRFSSAGQPGLT